MNGRCLPVPTLDQTFRDYVCTSVLTRADAVHRDFARKVIEEKWVGMSTRSLQMHLRARCYLPDDEMVLARLIHVWEKWLHLRSALDDALYVAPIRMKY